MWKSRTVNDSNNYYIMMMNNNMEGVFKRQILYEIDFPFPLSYRMPQAPTSLQHLLTTPHGARE